MGRQQRSRGARLHRAAAALLFIACCLDAARAQNCSAGSGMKRGKCAKCPAGTASPGGTGACVKCPKPLQVATTDHSACVCVPGAVPAGACTECKAGFGGKTCKKCTGTNKYNPGGKGVANCLTCPKAIAPLASSDKTGCVCGDKSKVWAGGSCEPPCPGNKVQDPTSKACVCPAATPDEVAGQCVPACTGGAVRVNATGACACPADKPDTVNGACVPTCTGGKQRNGAGVCACGGATPDDVGGTCFAACASGKVHNPDGTCVCPPDKSEELNGQCLAPCTGGSTRNPTTLACDCPPQIPDYVNGECMAACTVTGQTHTGTGGACVCPADKPDTVNGACVPACTGGKQRNATGVCVCPADKTDEVAGQCLAPCTGGAVRNPTTLACECPSNLPDLVLGTCVAACPAGTVRQAGTVNCVAQSAGCWQAGLDACATQAICSTAVGASISSCACINGYSGDGNTCTQAAACAAGVTIQCPTQPASCRYYMLQDPNSDGRIWVENGNQMFCVAQFMPPTVPYFATPSNLFAYTSRSPTTGEYVQDGNRLYCPPAGTSSTYAVQAAWTPSSGFGFCMTQKKYTITSDAVPADCSAPAKPWTCTSGACWIDTSKRDDVLTAYNALITREFGAVHQDDGFQYACMNKNAWVGGDQETCVTGSNTDRLKDWNTVHINYYRAMAGVFANVSRFTDYETSALAAANMMSKNAQLSHDPPNTWSCWSQAGHDAASTSNLYLWNCGISAIRGFMLDPGANNKPVGHRTGILFRDLQWSATGTVFEKGSYKCAMAQSVWAAPPGWVRTELPIRQNYIAWPPAGFVPASVVFPRWHFQWPPSNTWPPTPMGADLSTNVAVTMTRDGAPVTVTIIYQDADIIVWETADPWIAAFSEQLFQPLNDVVFQVTISQVSPALVIKSYAITVFGVDGLAYGPYSSLGRYATPAAAPAAAAAAGAAAVEDQPELGPVPVMPADWGRA